jgi:hypothetical protein
MTVETLLLTATTLIALVAVIAAVVAIRAVRRLEHQAVQSVVEAADRSSALETADVFSRLAVPARTGGTSRLRGTTSEELPELEPRVVQGRVIVPPTQAQVVRTALGRPGVRLSVLAHGLARALRAENRDRIVSLMRREYRYRRRERLRAGRQAVRIARPTSAPSTERLHAEFAEPRPLSLAERMIGS